MPNVKVNKHADKIAKLLFSIETVPPLEVSKMKRRAVKYACGEIDKLEALLTECIDLIEFQPMQLSQRGKQLVNKVRQTLEDQDD